MSTQQRMKDTSPKDKPRVYKVLPGGMWWADGWHSKGHYVFDVFPTYTEALDQAHEYAAMNKAANALRIVTALEKIDASLRNLEATL